LNISIIDQFFTRSQPQPPWLQNQRREEEKREAVQQPQAQVQEREALQQPQAQVQERGAMQQVQEGQLKVNEKQVHFLCKFQRFSL